MRNVRNLQHATCSRTGVRCSNMSSGTSLMNSANSLHRFAWRGRLRSTTQSRPYRRAIDGVLEMLA